MSLRPALTLPAHLELLRRDVAGGLVLTWLRSINGVDEPQIQGLNVLLLNDLTGDTDQSLLKETAIILASSGVAAVGQMFVFDPKCSNSKNRQALSQQ